MFASIISKRLCNLPSIAKRHSSTANFLYPQVNPLGKFAKPISNTDGGNEGNEEPKRAYTLWSLAERRALLLFSRAIYVASKKDPDWVKVGRVLERDPHHCRFISRYISKQWMEHNPWLASYHAGVSIKDLEMLKANNEKTRQAVKKKWDDKTLLWLVRLTDAVDDADAQRQKPVASSKRHKWSDEEKTALFDHMPLFRHPTESDLKEFLKLTGVSYSTAKVFISNLRVAFRRSVTDQLRPLTKKEHDIINQAAKERAPHMARWMDVKDKLKDRTFDEINYLLVKSVPRFIRNPEKCANEGPKAESD